MSDYVLEILDGDQAGTVVELDSDRLSIGRRPGNDLVLADEKCSGKHAEIVFEDGGVVLRDLGSTNGTFMDGRRIEEMPLTAGDVFQVGRVRVRFRATATQSVAGSAGGGGAAGGGAEVEDVQMHRLDAAALKRGRGRGSMFGLVLGVLVLGAGGFWVWQTWFAGGAAGGGAGGAAGAGGKSQKPLEVAGNLLPGTAASFEGDAGMLGEGDDGIPTQSGWILETGVGGSSFGAVFGRGMAHTGESAVEAVGHDAAAEGVARFALARLAQPLRVASERPLRLAAHLRTSGAARGAARLVFSSSADAEGPQLRTGLPLRASEDWQQFTVDVAVPRGMDRVQVELLALLPDQDAVVTFDDVAVTAEGDGRSLYLQSRNGRTLIGAGGVVRIDAHEESVLLDAAPVVDDDAGLAALESAGLLEPSDLGFRVDAAVLEDGTGFALSFVDGTGDLALVFPTEGAGVRARAGAGGFAPVDPEFRADDVHELVLGTTVGRVALRFDPPAAQVGGRMGDDGYRILLGDERALDCVVDFTAERERATELLRAAEEAAGRGAFDAALTTVEELVTRWPHATERMREAQTLRSKLLEQQQARVDDLLEEGGEAAFFEARVGYRRVLREVEALIADFGASNIARLDELQALQERLEAGLATLDAREGQEHGALLTTLADAFETAGQDALAERIRGYVETHYADLKRADQQGDGSSDEGEGR